VGPKASLDLVGKGKKSLVQGYIISASSFSNKPVTLPLSLLTCVDQHTADVKCETKLIVLYLGY